jgi:RNA:NAD 2'-phosphotransferase (TPT1/KptA family)
MGRGGHGGGSRNPANQSRDVQVSRKISWLLRHGAQSEGLKLGKGGYVNVQDAVSLRNFVYHLHSVYNLQDCETTSVYAWDGFDISEAFSYTFYE